MKARALQKRLGTTRVIHFSGGKVCIASAYISELIVYNIEKNNVRFALESKDAELTGLIDALKAMAESGEILKYIDGEDHLTTRVPVYSCDDDGNVVESFTDKVGWPNVTADGVMMYDNTHFQTKEEAITSGIKNCEAGIMIITQSVKEAEQHLAERRAMLDHEKACLTKLEQHPERKSK